MDKAIEARLRGAPPSGCSVVLSSTPVLAFGDFTEAEVATLGLNPSKKEFLGSAGELLLGADARFETLESLGVETLSSAPMAKLDEVVSGCARYFHQNPYWRWFNPLEEVLKEVGVSFSQGTACHIDLVQWATDPVWGKLTSESKRCLLDDGLPFLKAQLSSPKLRAVVANGSGVLKCLKKQLNVRLTPAARLNGPRDRPIDIVMGQLRPGLRIIGWSPNLQSSRGVTRLFRKELAVEVGKLLNRRVA